MLLGSDVVEQTPDQEGIAKEVEHDHDRLIPMMKILDAQRVLTEHVAS